MPNLFFYTLKELSKDKKHVVINKDKYTNMNPSQKKGDYIMKNKNTIIGVGVCVAMLVAVGGMFGLMSIRGKAVEEVTNVSDGDEYINRGTQTTTGDDCIDYDSLYVSYELPDGFYFEYEDKENIENGVLREYMDHDYNKMLDIYIYEDHVGTVGLIDMDNSDNTTIYKDINIDAQEWFREMRLVYLDRDDENDIKSDTVGDKTVTYFTEYEKAEDGVMRGKLVGYIELDDTHYYAVALTEFDQDREPGLADYKSVFNIALKQAEKDKNK